MSNLRKTLTHVRDLDSDEVGPVIDLLSAQFTAEIGGRVRFYFWTDRGVTWKEEKQ